MTPTWLPLRTHEGRSEMQNHITVSELAKITGFSANRIYIMAREKRLPHMKFGHRIFFPKNILQSLTIKPITK
jgi:excisionase family DNA binding protein